MVKDTTSDESPGLRLYLEEAKTTAENLAPTQIDDNFFDELRDKWNSLSETEKQSYETRAREEKTKKPRKPKAPLPEGHPKRNLNSWSIFASEWRSNAQKQNPTITFSDCLTGASVEWKRLSEDEKRVYTELAKKEKARYDEELSLFNEAVEELKPTMSS
ncbi:hypothetical protein RCL1_002233 [Eukaryota sp. TZLM3-RCL]